MTAPEFSRPERLDAIGNQERSVAIAADGTERAALARRFTLVAIDTLAAQFTLKGEAAGILVTGRVTAALTQACSVTDEPLTVRIDEPVALRFTEAAVEGEEVELSTDLVDTVEIEGGAIDLGEVAAETLLLALDPYPRGPNAAAALKAAGVISEEDAAPMGALGGLKALLERRDQS